LLLLLLLLIILNYIFNVIKYINSINSNNIIYILILLILINNNIFILLKNMSILFDGSCGLGVLIDSYPAPLTTAEGTSIYLSISLCFDIM
jgi:hypothetical protein